MSNKFVSVLETIGRDFLKGLQVVEQILPIVGPVLIGLWPESAVPITITGVVANLIQNAVVLVEQKYAAMGKQTGTGPQKLAEVTALVAAAVKQLLSDKTTQDNLAKMGVVVDDKYVISLINLVVATLNSQGFIVK